MLLFTKYVTPAKNKTTAAKAKRPSPVEIFAAKASPPATLKSQPVLRALFLKSFDESDTEITPA